MNAPSTSLAPRARHKAAVREALVQASRALFRARGFEATTVDEIAAAAGVSRRTFFRYFAGKDAVVFPYAEERLALFEGLLAPRGKERPFATLRRACRAMAEHFVAHEDELRWQHELIEGSASLLAFEQRLDRRWEEALATAISGQARRVSTRDAALAGAAMGALRALLREWYAGRGQRDLVALIDEVLELLAPAFGEGTS
ncbi:MAG: TetR family transcriptional regulator [Planctomycetota bacterium]